MKRPQHMTMKELIALPVLDGATQRREQPVPVYAAGDIVYGGAFEDDRGEAWGTILSDDGWVRYPLRRLTRQPFTVRTPIKALFDTSRRAVFRLSA